MPPHPWVGKPPTRLTGFAPKLNVSSTVGDSEAVAICDQHVIHLGDVHKAFATGGELTLDLWKPAKMDKLLDVLYPPGKEQPSEKETPPRRAPASPLTPFTGARHLLGDGDVARLH